jgi:hypothetical protein
MADNEDPDEKVRKIPLPRSLANTRRQATQKKWEEAESWANGTANRRRYEMPVMQRPIRLVG